MIIEDVKRDVVVSGDFEQTAFKINATGQAFSQLSSGIYTNKVAAVIRELCCNAYDSHVEAGVDSMYDVHLPTYLEPWFEIRDYGTGLSHEDCMKVYTTYFYSTKTASNELIGCLGLGSKVGYSIADSFVVTSYYNGVKSEYSAYKDENDCPQFALLGTDETNEPNGLSVKIAIRNMSSSFEIEAVKVIQYFDHTPNINNTKVLEEIEAARVYDIKTDDYAFTNDYGRVKAIMGGVAYDIPSSIFYWDFKGYIKFDIGDLRFNTGRESLVVDDKTKAKILEKKEEVLSGLSDHVEAEIMAETTEFKRAKKANALFRGEIGKMCDKSIKDKYKLPKASTPFTVFQLRGNVMEKLETRELPLDAEYYLDKPRFTARIREYLKGRVCKRVVLLTQAQAGEVKVDELLNLENLPKPVKQASCGVRNLAKVFTIKDLSCYRISHGSKVNNFTPVEVEIDSDEEKVYIVIDRFDSPIPLQLIKSDLRDLSKFGVDITIDQVYAVKTAVTKLKGFDKGNWVPLTTYIQRKVAGLKSFKPLPYSTAKGIIEGLEIFTEYHDAKRNSKDQGDYAEIAYRYNLPIELDTSLCDAYNVILTKYPLIKHLDYSTPNDLIKYYVKGLS